MVHYRIRKTAPDLRQFFVAMKILQITSAVSIGLVLVLFGLKNPSLAAVRCETQYGGTEVCVKTGELQIDKEVFDPQNNKFVDNLGISNHKFAPGDEIRFVLKVKNVGDKTFSKVEVSDTLPTHFELVSGDLNFEIKDLKVGETREKEIKVKVKDNLPQDKTIICDATSTNQAEAKSDDEKDKDTSQVCVERKVLGARVLPEAGAEAIIPTLLSSLAAILGGSYLLTFRRRTV